jgi:ArsR family transcriptional regulator, virulence genes transcriptional regulator
LFLSLSSFNIYSKSAGIISTYLYIFVQRKHDRMEFKDLNPESLEKAANMLKAIAHPLRISIVGCLEDGKKRTVTEIHKQLGIEQSTASHHLGILKDRGVLGSKREGKNTWYFLKHENLKTILSCVSSCCQQ